MEREKYKEVLILVLMEYALREIDTEISENQYYVLILVLMEYALRDTKTGVKENVSLS